MEDQIFKQGSLQNMKLSGKEIVFMCTRTPGGVLPMWPDRGVQSGLKRVKAEILKNTLKWQYLFTKTLKW